MTASTPAAGTAPVQGRLWSARARDWAEVQEATVLPLFDAVADRLGVGAGTRLLDVGCGAGRFLRQAADRGAEVAGLDAAPALLAIARERLPAADLHEGEMEQLPWDDGSFDAVAGINAFQYAARPAAAVAEAARVVRHGALVAIASWGRPDDCEAAAYLHALGTLLPPPPPGAPGPFALSEPGALVSLATHSQISASPASCSSSAVTACRDGPGPGCQPAPRLRGGELPSAPGFRGRGSPSP